MCRVSGLTAFEILQEKTRMTLHLCIKASHLARCSVPLNHDPNPKAESESMGFDPLLGNLAIETTRVWQKACE